MAGKRLQIALSCAVLLSACGGGGDDGGGRLFCQPNNPAPRIDGIPPTQATVGQEYRFFADAEWSCLGGFPLPVVPGTCFGIEGVQLPPGAQAVSGSVVWTPPASSANTNASFTIRTPEDLCGGRATKSWVVSVSP